MKAVDYLSGAGAGAQQKQRGYFVSPSQRRKHKTEQKSSGQKLRTSGQEHGTSSFL
jgi:ribosomal protein S21